MADKRILVRAQSVQEYFRIEKGVEISIEDLRRIVGDMEIKKMYELLWKRDKEERVEKATRAEIAFRKESKVKRLEFLEWRKNDAQKSME